MAQFVPMHGFISLYQAILPEFEQIFRPGDRIAVKLHMGEAGNNNYISPDIVRKIISILKEAKTEPFLFDSPAMYPGGRDTPEKYIETARLHGFSKESIGCDIIVSDSGIAVNERGFVAEVCKDIAGADGLLVLSHVKGHACSGFGAAIKNLGMGAVTKKTKRAIHEGGQPLVDPSRCTGCGLCQRICFSGAIKVENKVAVPNYDNCWGCSICIENCPARALSCRNSDFNTLLAIAAHAAISQAKKIYAINFLIRIAQLCDCCSNPGRIVLPDLGAVFGQDIADVDRASFDQISIAAKEDIFAKIHNRSPEDHIRAFEALG